MLKKITKTDISKTTILIRSVVGFVFYLKVFRNFYFLANWDLADLLR